MYDKSTVSTQVFGGIPVMVTNKINYSCEEPVEYLGQTYGGFYISYNNYDTHIYGDVTTALVVGQMEAFLILNGNHSEGYQEVLNAGKGFSGCLDYFNNHSHCRSKLSDTEDTIQKLRELYKSASEE